MGSTFASWPLLLLRTTDEVERGEGREPEKVEGGDVRAVEDEWTGEARGFDIPPLW